MNAHPEKLKMSPSGMLDAALGYLARGWSVIPVHRENKKPCIAWKMIFQTRQAN